MEAHSVMSCLINALPRKFVILNGRTFDQCLLESMHYPPPPPPPPRKLMTLNGRTFCLRSTLINALPPKARDVK